MVLYACSQAKIYITIAVLGFHFCDFPISFFLDSGQIAHISTYFRMQACYSSVFYPKRQVQLGDVYLVSFEFLILSYNRLTANHC